MSLFGKKKQEQQPQPQPETTMVDSPTIVLRLVDGIHLDVAIEWPENCDLEPFSQLLSLLNSGKLIAPQLAAASIYASQLNQPEKAIMITKALEEVSNAKKGKPLVADDDAPLIPASKFTHNLLKSHGH